MDDETEFIVLGGPVGIRTKHPSHVNEITTAMEVYNYGLKIIKLDYLASGG